ncbi:hypothetical protein MTO96_027667, partial [Rhipicephalus appendiculatus]
KKVGCQYDCSGPNPPTVPFPWTSEECLTVSTAGYDGMKPYVNYTCKLGLCGTTKTTQTCNPSNLFIDCWKLPE